MADVATRATIVSRVGVGKQSALGTPLTTPTNDLDPSDFQPTDATQPLDFELIRQSRNVVGEERQAAHKVGLAGTQHFHGVKGSPLWAWGVGHDTMSGAGGVAATIGSAVSIGDTTVSLTGVGAVPSGVTQWDGCWLEFTKAGGIVERKLITKIAGGVYSVHTPFVNSFATSDTAQFPIQHIIDENISTNAWDLSYFTAICQYADLYEKLMADGIVTGLQITGDNKMLTFKSMASFCALPVNNSTLTSWTKATAEKSDSPYIMMDGGLLTPFAVADTQPKMHSRLKSIDYQLTNDLIIDEYGGGQYLTEQYTVAARRQAVTWTEAAGQNSKNPDLYINFVRAEKTLAAFFAFVNKQSNACFGIWMPFCSVPAFDDVVAAGQVVGFSGRLLPREDPTTGRSVRVSIVNGTTVAY